MAPPYFSNLVSYLIGSAPGLLVCLAGLIIVLERRRSLGPAALPAVLGVAAFVMLGLLQPFVISFLPSLLKSAGGAVETHTAYTTVNLFFSCLRAGAYILLLLGIIQGRKPPEAP